MRHFLFEFFTGGGFSGQELPKTITHQGDLIINALLYDLQKIADVPIAWSRDSRLETLKTSSSELHSEYVIQANNKNTIAELIRHDDIVWLIAPEDQGYLSHYRSLFAHSAMRVIGSDIEAISLSSSKILTYQRLRQFKLPTPKTWAQHETIPDQCEADGWIIKPDDSSGAENCYVFETKSDLQRHLHHLPANYNYVIQEFFLNAKHASLSLLMRPDQAYVIGCNRQYIRIDDQVLSLSGLGVNEYRSYIKQLLPIVEKLPSAFAGLYDYIGVDLIYARDQWYIIEINPRFTTSYAGLSRSLNKNVAEMILNEQIADIDLSTAQTVQIDL